MNPVLQKIQKEWERTLLAIVFLVVLVCLGVFAYVILNREDSSGSESNRFRTPHVYFDVTSRVYMNGPALDKKARSPMAYSLKVRIPPTVERPKPADTKPKPPDAKPKPKPQENKPRPKPQDTKPKPQENKPKPKPAPPPIKITVKYRGCMQFGEGKPVVFCTSTSSKDNKARPASLHKGDKVHGLFTIEGFDDKALNLSYDGKKVSVPRGKEHVFTVKQ
ncbi:MAG: hypothetical protein IKS20_10980 [Victivallales bacterium]|nr:hypothetical protein [Victivallales bacterium]